LSHTYKMKTKPLKILSTNFASSQLGSLIYGILDTKLGITAALMATGVSIPALIAFIGTLLGLEGWKVWKEAKNDDEKLKILKTVLLSEITKKQKPLEEEFAVKEFDNEQDHQRFVQLIRMLHQSIVEIRQTQKETMLSVDEVRAALKNHIETHEQLRKLLPINNLPYLSMGDLFKGRETVLSDLLRQQDATVTTAITQRMTMTGLGGIGKTRLAVEFAWEGFTRGVFRDVFFVRCGQDDKTTHSKEPSEKNEQQDQAGIERLQAAVSKLGVKELLAIDGYAEKKNDILFAEVLGQLQQRDKWLLIFDNVDDMGMRDAVLTTLPMLNMGRVVITSRLSDWGSGVKKIELKKLDKEPARDYLLQKTESSRVKSENDKSLAEVLAGKNYLDGLPVALEQAGAYICRMKISFAKYLEEYSKNQKDVLAWEKKNKLPEDYPRPVLTTWQMTEQKLTEAERSMLYLAAFLAPENIPVELFEKNAAAVAEIFPANTRMSKTPNNSLTAIREVLAGLADWSMAEFEGESFSVHRLVQETTRLRMDMEQQEEICKIVLSLFTNTDPGISPDDVRSWWYWKRMEGHIAVAVGCADNLQIKQPTFTLMNNLGLYYNTQARYAQAEPLYRRALEINEIALGSNHPTVATCLNNLATLLETTNRLNQAELLYRRALEINEKSFGKDHPNVARALNNLAELLRNTNRLKEAEPLYRRALEIAEKSLGPNHPNVAKTLNNLAELLRNTNRLKEAEPLYRRAFEILGKSLGPNNPNVATALNNLALLLKATNRLKGAESLIRRALEIDEKSFGSEHPKVAIDINNLAALLHATNRKDEAQKLFERAVKIFEGSLGPDHPTTQTIRRNLASLG